MTLLAMDIGASSGKLTRATVENGIIRTETVHRFENRLVTQGGHLTWDIDHLYDEMMAGLSKAGSADYVTIDTWAVDYVLLDGNGERLAPAISYRDHRTENVHCPVSRAELYRRTGIQHQAFNTIYQLLSQKEEDPSILEKAEHLLMVPDYLAWRLTGTMVQEYTNASTTGLLKAGTREWDRDLIDTLGLPQHLFGELSMSGKVLGPVNAPCGGSFILAPTHDTAAAVLAAPLGRESLYLSSGTWSLLGCIEDVAYTGEDARSANLTNEGADDGRIRLLKNIMGTWMLQSIRHENGDISFDEMCNRAMESRLVGTVDATAARFLSPSSMSGEIKAALKEQGADEPEDIGELAKVVYHSLALAYKNAVAEIEGITGRRFDHLAIVGGGSKDDYLNSLTREYTGLEVTAGPTEASAIGAILSALIHTGEAKREDIPALLEASFDIKHIGGK